MERLPTEEARAGHLVAAVAAALALGLGGALAGCADDDEPDRPSTGVDEGDGGVDTSVPGNAPEDEEADAGLNQDPGADGAATDGTEGGTTGTGGGDTGG